MRLNITAFIFAMLATIPFASAGNEKGNGGDIVVCTHDGKVQSIEFLDLYESRIVYGRTPNLGVESLTTMKKIERVAERMRPLFPNWTAELLEHARTFESRVIFTESELEDIPDTGAVLLPMGCAVRQLIIRTKTLPVPGKLFLINSIYWNQLDADSRAAAIIHEFIYGRGVDLFSHEDSFDSRLLHSYVLSSDSADINRFDWTMIFIKSRHGFDEYWGSYNISGAKNPRIDINENEKMISGTTTQPFSLDTKNLGHARLGAGKYILTYSEELPTLEAGNLESRHTFEHRLIRVTGSGEYSHGEYDYLHFSGKNIQIESLQIPGLELTPSPDCLTSISIDRWDRISLRFRECAVEVRYHPRNIHIKTEPGSSLYIYNDADKIQIKANTTTDKLLLEWDYGTSVLKNTILELKLGPDSLIAEAYNSPRIGHFPKLFFGNTPLERVPFTKIEIPSFKDHRIAKIVLAGERYEIPLHPGFNLISHGGSPIYYPSSARWDSPSYGATIGSTYNRNDEIAVSRLDGFSGEFRKGFGDLRVDSSERFTVNYGNDHTFPLKEQKWISKVETRYLWSDEDRDEPWEAFPIKNFLAKVYSPSKIELDFSTAEVLKHSCGRETFNRRLFSTNAKFHRITLTSEGAKKFGSSRFEQILRKHAARPSKRNLEMEICLTRDGLQLTDIRKQDKN